MQMIAARLVVSPTDLANHLACQHLSMLDLGVAQGRLAPATGGIPGQAALVERGRMHEAAFVAALRARNLACEDLRGEPTDASGVAATIAAMRRGVDAIVQAPLGLTGDASHSRPGQHWVGRADVLRRVPRPSELGPWSYEPVDTKLARETRGGTILQLCVYAEMLAALQGVTPEQAHVVTPGEPVVEQAYRLADYQAYYRFVRGRFGRFLDSAVSASTYPHPVAHCDVCRWWSACDQRRRADDHLSLVAGIRTSQIVELSDWQVTTLERLGRLAAPFERRPRRGSSESLMKVREQARVQLEGREQRRPVHEMLPVEPGTGLCRLPEPSTGDVFLDFEGDPFVEGGREYLIGRSLRIRSGRWYYVAHWALTHAEENTAFRFLAPFLHARRAARPGMHVYHYGAYEAAAMRRLMGKHAACEDEVDAMLRGGVFVDLHAIVRQAVRASVEQYSLKSLEPLYGYTRRVPLPEASERLREIEYLVECGDVGGVSDEARRVVQGYNRDDCESAEALRDWLEERRTELIARGVDVPRPAPREDVPPEELAERLARVRPLMERLLRDVPIEPDQCTADDRARWLLAQLLEFHRREDKSAWWEFFRLADLTDDERYDDGAALAGLVHVERVVHPEGRKRTVVDRYRFSPQEVALREGVELFVTADRKIGTLAAIDRAARTIDIRKTVEASDDHPASVFERSIVGSQAMADALFRIGSWVAEHGMAGAGSYRASRDLLLCLPPRLVDGVTWQAAGESSVARAERLALALDCSVLPIQGPPGSGKTYAGARMICELVRAGKRVGVTATSHKVIRCLLDRVGQVARERGLSVRCLQKVSELSADPHDGIVVETAKNSDVVAALAGGHVNVAGGTAWLWSRPELFESIDVLVVDEAGQMSLANVVAAAQAAQSVILLGDPQQLEQPLQGAHPEGTALSALHHVLGGHPTIPDDKGLFLAETWRLHPTLCAFTSEVFYEGKLRSCPGLENQALIGPEPFAGAGLYFAPVSHEGNQNLSIEEVDVVARLVHQLTETGTWCDADGHTHPIRREDVLIVAPYNAQVYAIEERLPGARVGTVDRFQGQEAPVVICSMTTSSADDAPRGMEFLYSLNRLNVATSRARCAVIVVASPRLFEPDCRSPGQMRLANAFCRYLELASPVELG
jgi:predicted RecB family nuclease